MNRKQIVLPNLGLQHPLALFRPLLLFSMSEIISTHFECIWCGRCGWTALNVAKRRMSLRSIISYC